MHFPTHNNSEKFLRGSRCIRKTLTASVRLTPLPATLFAQRHRTLNREGQPAAAVMRSFGLCNGSATYSLASLMLSSLKCYKCRGKHVGGRTLSTGKRSGSVVNTSQ